MYMMVGSQRGRKVNVSKTRRLVREMGETAMSKAVATVCVELGVQKSRAREYISVLTDYGYFEVEEDTIRPVEEAFRELDENQGE